MTARALLVAFAVAVVATGAAGEEVEAVLGWVSGAPEAYLPRGLPLSAEPPEGVEPIPEAAGVRYGRVEIADGWVLLYALRTKPGEVTLWVDRGDGVLTDEKGVRMLGTAYRVVTTVLLAPPEETGTLVPFLFDYRPKAPRDRFRVEPMAHREGEVVLEGRVRRIVARDRTGDLRLDAATDTIYVDLDGDGVANETKSSPERVVPGRAFRLRRRGWSLRLVDPSGRRLVFAHADETPPPPPPRWTAHKVPPAGVKAPGSPLTAEAVAAMYEKAAKRDLELPPAASTHTRRRELGKIGRSGSPAAARLLLKIARTERAADLRAAALRGLGYRSYVNVEEQVRGILRRERDSTARVAAMDALHGMDAPGRGTALLAVLRSTKDARVAAAAATHLAWIGSPESEQALGEAIVELTRVEHRAVAYRAATRFRAEPPSADLIRRAARADGPELRALALADARTLRIPDRRDLALGSVDLAAHDAGLARIVVEILALDGDAKSVRALLPLSEHLDPKSRSRLVALLRPIRDPEATAVLRDALGHRKAPVRSLAAAALGAMPGPSVVEALLGRLAREEDRAALIALIRALGRHRAAAAADGIVAVARRHRGNRDLREVALVALASIGLRHEKVRAFFEECVASKDAGDRVLALDAAASGDDAAAADLLLAHLEDKAWSVRLTAAQGLGRVRVKRAVAPLVARLEEERHVRVRRALAETLFRLTGADLGDVTESWRRWLEKHGNSFEVPAAIPERRRPVVAGSDVPRFYGIPIESERVVFVIDKSGSMTRPASTDKNIYDRAVDEALAAIEKLGERSRVSVILFDDEVHAWTKRLVKPTKAARAELARFLRGKTPTGNTNLFDALERALLTKEVDTVVLLSDGEPNRGRLTGDDEIRAEVRRLNRLRRIVIHGVSLGGSSRLLYELARENGGTYVRR